MKNILFLCTGNSCRSQMAEVIMNALLAGRAHAVSAGARPAGYVHPLAIEVLKEAGYPTEGLRSKSWEEFQTQPMDMVVTVCDRAKEACPIWPGHPLMVHWGFEDPADVKGDQAFQKKEFVRIMKEIRQTLQTFSARVLAGATDAELADCARKLERSRPA